jgi:hypothetical protein
VLINYDSNARLLIADRIPRATQSHGKSVCSITLAVDNVAMGFSLEHAERKSYLPVSWVPLPAGTKNILIGRAKVQPWWLKRPAPYCGRVLSLTVESPELIGFALRCGWPPAIDSLRRSHATPYPLCPVYTHNYYFFCSARKNLREWSGQPTSYHSCLQFTPRK